MRQGEGRGRLAPASDVGRQSTGQDDRKEVGLTSGGSPGVSFLPSPGALLSTCPATQTIPSPATESALQSPPGQAPPHHCSVGLTWTCREVIRGPSGPLVITAGMSWRHQRGHP